MWIANGSDEKTYAFLMTFCIISSFILSIFFPLANNFKLHLQNLFSYNFNVHVS